MLIGYMRVSKADGSQSTDLQRDALIRAGVRRSAPLLRWAMRNGSVQRAHRRMGLL